MDQTELAECLWMPLEDFLADTEVHSFNKLVVRAATSTGGLLSLWSGAYGP
ncbi:hypothetical protein FACS1894110_25020 [Spirochaetia bacterium]|nr:hypothetical protein FACS1894110_25020 [Spirochaetia bacterium]